MPAPPIMDLGSGMNSQKVIQQLMELEKIPIQRLKEDNQKNKVLIEAWEAVRSRTLTLQEKSRELYSFAGPFARKQVISSDPGAITGEATASVKDVSQDIEVLALASNHKIHSKPFSNSERLPAGKITIRNEDKEIHVSFPGGDLKSLTRLLQEKGKGMFEAFQIRIDGENSLLGMKSSVSGKRGRLKFDDPDGILQKIGLLGRAAQGAKETEDLQLSPGQVSVNKEKTLPGGGDFSLSKDGKSLEMGSGTGVNIQKGFPSGSILRFALETSESSTPEMKQNGEKGNGGTDSTGDASGGDGEIVKKERISTGPEIEVNIEDVTLHGYQIERSRDKRIKLPGKNGEGETGETPSGEGKEPSLDASLANNAGIGVIWEKDGSVNKREISIQPGNNEIHFDEITEGGEVKSFYFFTPPQKNLKLSSLSTETSAQEGDSLVPGNVSEEGNDARLNINGVEVTRPSNTAITDLIDGASINFHRVTDGPVTVQVKADSEKILKSMNEWVTAYNDLLKFLKENSRAASEDDYRENLPAGNDNAIGDGLNTLDSVKGVFSADSTVRRLISVLRQDTSNAYPSDAKPEYRILDEIGISTGKPGDDWEQIKHGYLKLDEEKFAEALNKSPESVKALFVWDRNNDLMPDTGVAFTLAEHLKPYTRNSGGLITVRIDLLRTKITDNKERMDRMQLSLKSKEEKLRMKFGAMEQAVNESKSVGKYLKNNLKGAE